MGPVQIYLSSQQVCARLGITPATLYAYVSRGLIRSEETPHSRSKRYWAEDVEALLERRELKKSPEQVVTRSLDWGTPLLESGICLIQAGQFYYRGENAVKLSQSQSFEAVLALLWQSNAPDWEQIVHTLPSLPGSTSAEPLLQLQQGLLALAEAEPRCWDLRPEGVLRTGGQILAVMTQRLCGAFPGASGVAQGVAHTLAERWLPNQAQLPELLNQTLILCAEHELNISSFSVRCAASAGCHPVQALLAGLACFSGSRHGGAWARVEALLQECERAETPERALTQRLQRGEELYGFGHPLYPAGDPRWQALQVALQARFAQSSFAQSSQFPLLKAVTDAVFALCGEYPSLDFALVALCRLHGLPLSCAPALFALGRAGGWLAHLQEEYALKRLIRPRARYTGPQPQHEQNADLGPDG